MESQEKLKFYDVPVVTWLVGLAFLGASVYFFNLQIIMAVLLGVIGLILLVLNRGLTITADKTRRALVLDYWSPFLWRTVKEIPFDEIATVRVDSMRSHEGSNRHTRTSRIE